MLYCVLNITMIKLTMVKPNYSRRCSDIDYRYTIVHVIFSLGLIITVLMQSGKSEGLSGSIAGGAETFFGKKKGMDELLGKLTSVFAVLFIITSVVLAIV